MAEIDWNEKMCIKKILGCAYITNDELETVLCDIEATRNGTDGNQLLDPTIGTQYTQSFHIVHVCNCYSF